MSDKTTGSCLCGAISYAFTGAPKVTALCHCTDCQKWSGSAYTSNAVVPRSSFEVTRGTPKNWNVVGDSGKGNNHFFCSNCGSSLYTLLEVMPDDVCVKAGGLDGGKASLDSSGVNVEFYTKDRVPFATAVGGADQKSAFG